MAAALLSATHLSFTMGSDGEYVVQVRDDVMSFVVDC